MLTEMLVDSFPICLSIKKSPQSNFPTPHRSNEKFNCRPVLSACSKHLV